MPLAFVPSYSSDFRHFPPLVSGSITAGQCTWTPGLPRAKVTVHNNQEKKLSTSNIYRMTDTGRLLNVGGLRSEGFEEGLRLA